MNLRAAPADILNTVQHLLIEKFGLEPHEVHAGAALDKLGIDSLAAIEIMFALEETFDLAASEAPAAVRTVGEIAEQIDALMSRQGRGGAGARA